MQAMTNQTEIADPRELSRLGRMEVIASRVVEGYLAGLHRSPYKGSSVEFAEFRPYAPGDETRTIDWRVYARSDRYYIKQFEEETNMQALLVVDASGSMAFGLSTVTKYRYGAMLAAAMAHLLLRQQDGAGLAVVDDTLREFIPPRTAPSHFMAISGALERTQPRGATALADRLHELSRRLRRRGLVVICSDGFDDTAAMKQAFGHLRSCGHDVIFFHIMAPEERTFQFGNWTRFEDLELAGHHLDLDPPAIRKQYLEQVGRFLEELKKACGEAGVDYLPILTDQPMVETLAAFFDQRAARCKRRGRA